MLDPPGSADGVRVRVTRDLGLFDLTMSAVGAMVGAAIFLLIGATYTVAGPFTVAGVVLAGFIALLSGLAYAELAAGRPGGTGGAYEWVRIALPAPSGFLSGWVSWSGHIAASALSALGLGTFLLELFAPSGDSFPAIGFEARLIGLVFLLTAAGFHLARIHVSARTLGRLTFVKVLLILGVAVIGFLSLSISSADRGPGAIAEDPGILGLFLGAGVFFIAFQGFEIIAQLSDQAKNPDRTVPRGILLSVGLSLGVYALLFLSVLGNAPTSLLGGWPSCAGCGQASQHLGIVAVGNLAFGEPWTREIFLLVGIASMYGALNANLTSAVKISFGMARDGLLPRVFSRVGGREVPLAALLGTTAVAGFLLGLSLETIAILAGLAFLLLFSFVQAAVIALRRQERRSIPGFRVPLVPALPLFAVVLNLSLGALVWHFPAAGGARMPAGVTATYLGAFWLAVGLILHWFAGGREALRRPGGSPGIELTDILAGSEEEVELEKYRVFLPLREFEDHALVDFGARVAKARGGELSLLNVVEVPRNLPPKAVRFRYVDERIKGLQKLARIGGGLGVDTRPVVKIGSKVYEIILDTIREEAVNLLVMGWRGARVEGDRRILGSNIDYLIENAPCDVVVFKTPGLVRPLRRLVIVTSPIWSLRGIGELALVLADEDRAAIEVLGLAGEPGEAERLKQEAEPFLRRCHMLGLPVEHKILYSRYWESVALQESEGASVLLIRASSPGGLRKYALGPVEDRVVKLAKCPVVILREGAPQSGTAG
ncbi:MAG: hypothetical protein A3K68_06590 [Euryarchaeota archaeon RBG_16_68_13]|nr:MAG: hypothetical protein A3K68_06590 [Euryarchaeota archaeon RBG_16_68_13]